jgi:hypothetical protein
MLTSIQRFLRKLIGAISEKDVRDILFQIEVAKLRRKREQSFKDFFEKYNASGESHE